MSDSESKYYLAVDIGASSGRHILGSVVNGKIRMEEIHRFENGMKKVDGHKCWEVERLFKEIVTGLKKCKEIGKIPVSMAIDTWGVDYVLLDRDGDVLGKTYGYRDDRTQGMDELVEKLISKEALYEKTGIQKQIFNTIYQLMALKEQEPEILAQAERLLLIPDYLNYKLTGEVKTEYTNATTTQLVSPRTKDWDRELMELLGIPKKIFGGITIAGTFVGRLTKEMEREVGFNLDIVQAASHDTASAVVSVPAEEKDFLYISSGTWSLMGVEREEADYSQQSRLHNFTNEGGYEYRYRYLKNIMGLWMQQSVKKEYEDKYSYHELWELMQDMEKAMEFMPGKKKLNLHASYAIFQDGERVDRDRLEPKHFEKWVEFAKKHDMGIDFNPTFFSHDKVKDGLTLSSPDDETKEMAKEIVRNDALGRVYMALDFFDASINRISAWTVGFRSWQKALLSALLSPHEELKKLQEENRLTELMVRQEELKTLPFGDVWNEYCAECGVPVDGTWFTEVKRYEDEVLSKRG